MFVSCQMVSGGSLKVTLRISDNMWLFGKEWGSQDCKAPFFHLPVDTWSETSLLVQSNGNHACAVCFCLLFLVKCAHLNRGAFLLGCIISTYSCALGSNSHRFSVVGDGYPRNSQVLYTHEKDSLLKVGCPSPIQGVWTVARKIFIYIYIYIL